MTKNDFEYYDRYKKFIPAFFDPNDPDNDPDDPDTYEWEWKENTPQSIIDEYNRPEHYWNNETDIVKM